ncbi:membrane protein containing ABC transporter-like protein [Rhodopirellula sallentina SM41]|uniref:Membrane protein containing ABC transporter-like protein n=1 Tax=Rhodopirellula sallentina SM41 TaxID=1263870 RepID=M5U1M2_9BACT|nr:membrane protein containing ABC transporter-like protein [Rhodopirellula sallentina SM41]
MKDPPGRPLAFSIRDLSKCYSTVDGPALDRVSVDIPAGIRLAVLGRSAAGKSTLMHLLGLLDNPDAEGEIRYFSGDTEVNYADPSSSELTIDQIRGRHFGFVFQQGHLLEHLSCIDNVGLSMALGGRSRSERLPRVTNVLRRLGLEEALERSPRQLSGGQRQRVALGRALAHSPHVVFADEPTGNLDPENASNVMRQLVQWQKQGVDQARTLLLVTHDIPLAFQYCDHFLVVRGGKFVDGIFAKADIPRADKSFPTIANPDDLLDLMMHGQIQKKSTASVHASLQLTQAADHESEIDESETPEDISDDPAGNHLSGPPFGFIRHLAFRDIVRRESLGVTLVGWLILALMTVLCTVGWGLLEGKTRLLDQELSKPTARRLDINVPVGQLASIDDEAVERLSKITTRDGRDAFGDPAQQIRRWNQASFLFYQGNEDNTGNYSNGRTLMIGDPLIEAIEFIGEKKPSGFTDDRAPQIIIDQEFLADFVVADDQNFVDIAYKDSKIRLEILGVADKIPGSLPSSFIVPNGLAHSLQNHEVVLDTDLAELSHVSIAPVTRKEYDSCVGKLREFRLTSRFELSWEPDSAIKLTVKDDGTLTKQRLEQYADAIIAKMAEQEMVSGSLLVRFPPLQTTRSVPYTYQCASLYVNEDDVNELDRVADEAQTLGFEPMNSDTLIVLAILRNTVGPLRVMLTCVICVTFVVASLATGVSMWQRVRQKRHEIGILKACGMTTSRVMLVFGLEGLMLAVAAAAFSLPTSYAIGTAIGDYLAKIGKQDGNLFVLDPLMAACVCLILVMVCVGSCLFGTIKSARLKPAVSVR